MKLFDAVESFLERHGIETLWTLHEDPLVKMAFAPTPQFRFPMTFVTPAEARAINAYLRESGYKGEF